MKRLVKIRIPFQGGGPEETLWAEDLGKGLFKLKNEPLFFEHLGVGYGDVVRAKPTDHPDFYAFQGLVKKVGLRK